MPRTCVKRPPTFKFEQWTGGNEYDIEVLLENAKDGSYLSAYEWQGFKYATLVRYSKNDIELSRGNVIVVSSKGKLEVFDDMEDFEAEYEETLVS